MSYPSSGKESETQLHESILAQPFVEPILEAARENLQRDGSLMPVLFIRAQGGAVRSVPLELPATTEAKYAYFGLLGLALLSMGKRLDEALFLSESWYVSSETDPKLTLGVASSQPPPQREAITLVGRNARRTRMTVVVQPFDYDSEDEVFFDANAVEEYNIASGAGMDAVGILDALFTPRPSGTE